MSGRNDDWKMLNGLTNSLPNDLLNDLINDLLNGNCEMATATAVVESSKQRLWSLVPLAHPQILG